MRSSRPQMQPFARHWPNGRPSGIAILVAYMVAGACAQGTFHLLEEGNVAAKLLLHQWLALDAQALQAGHLWKFLSFTVLHGSLLALAAGALVLYFAGREVEPIVSTRHVVGMFALGNVVGGMAQWGAVAAGWLPADTLLMGTMAGVAAVLMAYATIMPELELTLMLFFVLPVRVRAKTLGLCLFLAAGALLWLQPNSSVGPVAMLMGGVVGWAYAKQLGFGNPMAIERYVIDRRQHAARLERMPAAQFMQEEIDPILEKIARSGTKSLTRAEKRLLEMGRAKLGSPSKPERATGPAVASSQH